MKIVFHTPTTVRFSCRGGQAAALFFSGIAAGEILAGNLLIGVIFAVVAAFAAAWGIGWRLFVRR